jgi:monofunctional biosynthetic peptidoglycan transglycosylase
LVLLLQNYFKALSFKDLIIRLLYIAKVFVLTCIGLSLYFTICFSFIPPQRTPLMLKRNFEQRKEKKEIQYRHQWVPIEEISPYLIQAVVATEDNRFTKHYGIDFGAIRKARDFNKRSTRRKRGASTISQQTAKNIFLWPARTYLRKGFEVILP